MRVEARRTAGAPARTPTNLVTAPPAAWIVLISGALSSGAVSSSWIWNLLTAVFTVTSVLASGSAEGGLFALQSLYLAFTLLSASYLRGVSYTCFSSPMQAGRSSSSLPAIRRSAPRRFIRLSLRPSRIPPGAQSRGRAPPKCRGLHRAVQGLRRPLRPPLVHRRARPAEELLGQRLRARRRLRRGDGLRRLVDPRLQSDRGARHARGSRSRDLRDDPLAA